MKVITAQEANRLAHSYIPNIYKDVIESLMSLIEYESEKCGSLDINIFSYDNDYCLNNHWKELKSYFISNFMQRLGYTYKFLSCPNENRGDYEVLHISWDGKKNWL